MCRYRTQAVFILICALSACSSVPSSVTMRSHPNPFTLPYWVYPAWQSALFLAVQSKVHLPTNENTAGIHGTVRFLIDNGVIKNPVIVASTGDPKLDTLMLLQVLSAKVPKPLGQHTDQPHEFELQLEMFTPYESFEYNVYVAIDNTAEYTRDPLLKDETGIATVAFDYMDGKALNIVIAKSSGHSDLDQLSVKAVSSAVMPAPPPGYTRKTVHLQAHICYFIVSSFSEPSNCPPGKNVIDVTGARIRRTAVVRN
jgi:outer membrane biosynthesis protein TonB